MDVERIKEEVMERSRGWIESFNSGDVDACVSAYTENAEMNPKPYGTYNGREEIDSFWRPLLSSGSLELEYSNVELVVIDENTAELSAEWKMRLARGVITKERWVRQGDEWMLEQDDFEVKEQL